MKPHVAILSLIFVCKGLHAQPGCTDPLASNYNAAATINDGSCTYTGATIGPKTSKNLNAAIDETSGLIHWNGAIWTHNDDTDTSLYAVDTASAAIIQSVALPRVRNKDWEDIAQDDDYIYIGDVGNNGNGNRTDLQILRIDKASLFTAPAVDTIRFSYADQTDFSGSGANNTDFDCEAFIVSADSIYLFTKQWVSNKSRIYALPKVPGTYSAEPRGLLNTNGMITGATFLEDKKLTVLCGYTNTLQPFLYVLYDYPGYDFTLGNKRRVNLNLGLHQVEGVATSNGLKYYVSNEALSQPPISIPQKLHTFDLANFLGLYLNGVPTGIFTNQKRGPISVYPNPARDMISITPESEWQGNSCVITDLSGREILTVALEDTVQNVDIRTLAPGAYCVRVDGPTPYSAVFIKQ